MITLHEDNGNNLWTIYFGMSRPYKSLKLKMMGSRISTAQQDPPNSHPWWGFFLRKFKIFVNWIEFPDSEPLEWRVISWRLYNQEGFMILVSFSSNNDTREKISEQWGLMIEQTREWRWNPSTDIWHGQQWTWPCLICVPIKTRSKRGL